MAPVALATYFSAERQGGFLLVVMALAGLGFGAFLWATRNAFVAMVWPLAVLGAFQLIIGPTIALRTPAQIAALEGGSAWRPRSRPPPKQRGWQR